MNKFYNNCIPQVIAYWIVNDTLTDYAIIIRLLKTMFSISMVFCFYMVLYYTYGYIINIVYVKFLAERNLWYTGYDYFCYNILAV